MTKTAIIHYYNEEFLIGHWLRHHISLFNRIIMIDYDSTDDSNEIIDRYQYDFKEMCDIVYKKSKNKDFGAMNVDLEIEEYEHQLDGWRITLNVTEFLYGDFRKCDETPTQHIIPSFMMVDKTYDEVEPSYSNLNWNHGIPYWVHDERAGRSFHNFNINYPKPGRHYFIDKNNYSQDFLIMHYGWFPMCDQTLNRKLQIQNRIPQYDINNRLGWHHITDREALMRKWNDEFLPKADNHKDYLDKYRKLTYVRS